MRTSTILVFLGLALVALCVGAPQSAPTSQPKTAPKEAETGSGKETEKKVVSKVHGGRNSTKKVTKKVANKKPASAQIQSKNGTHQAQAQTSGAQSQAQHQSGPAKNGTKPAFQTQSQSQNQSQSRVRREALDATSTASIITATLKPFMLGPNSRSTNESSDISTTFCGPVAELFSALGIKLEANGSGFDEAISAVCQSVNNLMNVISMSAMKRFSPRAHIRPYPINSGMNNLNGTAN